MTELAAAAFPPVERTVRATWAPVLLRPILGSPEQFVIGVAAAHKHGFYVEPANALRRLSCLYGKAADTAIMATEVALFDLETRLVAKGPDALLSPELAFTNVSLGPVQPGEAESLQSLARTWMAALSSLHRVAGTEEVTVEGVIDDEATERGVPDRLPTMVFDHITSIQPNLKNYFSEEIRKGQVRRSYSVTRISIDFSGSQLVANFATLRPGQRAASVDRIKRKAFDLIARRKEEKGSLAPREHEMIVFNPVRDSPLFSLTQINHVEEDLHELQEQAEDQDIGFRTVSSIPQIGSRLLTAENPH